MKTINETFTDDEFNNLRLFKRNLSWHDFIILMYSHCIDSYKNGNFEIYIKGGKEQCLERKKSKKNQ